MLKPKLYRLGSDPEFMFGTMQEWDTSVLSAAEVISRDRNIATRSFIGTDNHQATAEIRPTPSRNIWKHLFEIATAVQAIDTHLKKRDIWKNVGMLAHPMVSGEPLGGHIHISFFSKDPLMAEAAKYNVTFDPFEGRAISYDPNKTNTFARSVEGAKVAGLVITAAQQNAILTPWVMSTDLGYLFIPLERWIMPWGSRARRNGRYGIHKDVMRLMYNTGPKIMPEGYTSYWHYEYRAPSTWLVHPQTAFLYLGLAKFCMLNYPKLHNCRLNNNTRDEEDDAAYIPNRANNTMWKKIFLARWEEVSAGGIFSNDIRNLSSAIEKAGDRRKDWFDKQVDISAWCSLIG